MGFKVPRVIRKSMEILITIRVKSEIFPNIFFAVQSAGNKTCALNYSLQEIKNESWVPHNERKHTT